MAKRIGVVSVLLLVGIAFAAASRPAVPRPAAAENVPVGYQILEAGNGSFIVFYPPQFAKMARETGALLEESSGGIARELGLESIDGVKVIIASDIRAFERLHGGEIPEWGIAFADVENRVLGINVDLVERDPSRFSIVVRHELSHLLLAQRVGGASMPTWFVEGLAMMQAGEWTLSDEWRFMTTAGRRDLPYLEELRGPFSRSADRAALSYGMSYFAVRKLLADRPGSLMTLTAFIRDTGDFESGFESTFGQTVYDFAGRLYVDIDRRYKTAGAILNAAPYWTGAAFLFVAVYLVKRARNRRKLERWEEEEARERRFWY
ncbi:MAG: hypothetical protein NTW97_09295 [Candidatus Krumholzibacteria bacterium]|nr:hypothetical protein [Candidatus Krumholzibacteria bacterium]